MALALDLNDADNNDEGVDTSDGKDGDSVDNDDCTKSSNSPLLWHMAHSGSSDDVCMAHTVTAHKSTTKEDLGPSTNRMGPIIKAMIDVNTSIL